MIIEYLGHSAFNIISKKGINILIDPFISQNPRASTSINSLNPDIILVTHAHFDHFGDTIEIAKKSGAIVVTNYGLAPIIQKNHINTIGLNKGGEISITDLLKIKMVKAEHSSELDFNKMENIGIATGFIITLENGVKIYHAGDTALFGDMKHVIGDIYRPDISLLPIGDKYTMGIKDAAIACKWLKSKIIIPMHYDTYAELQQNTNLFKEYVYKECDDTKVIVLKPGESYSK